jgi:hypothetical protein
MTDVAFAFVGQPDRFTSGGHFLPPRPPEPDPPRWWGFGKGCGHLLASPFMFWSLFGLDMACLVWAVLDPAVLVLRVLVVVPTGLGAAVSLALCSYLTMEWEELPSENLFLLNLKRAGEEFLWMTAVFAVVMVFSLLQYRIPADWRGFSFGVERLPHLPEPRGKAQKNPA